jgi:hypothetical protein
MKKVLIIVLVYLIIVAIISCCPNTEVYNFDWIKIHLVNLNLKDNTFQSDETSDSIFLNNNFGIKIRFEGKLISKNDFIGLNLINSAYAKCPDDKYLTNNNITDIKIITLNNFDAEHPANS